MSRTGNALRVVLADDHHFFREGLRDMLESVGVSVVGEAKDGAQALTLVAELKPDLIVLDLDMSGAPGADALRRIAAASPRVRIVVLTAALVDVDVLELLGSGACGYILKSTPADELIDGIQTSASHVVLSHDVMGALRKQMSSNSRGAGAVRPDVDGLELTTREQDVLRLLVDGADNAAIGLKLSISRHTVKQHVTNIFEKLGVHNRVEAAVFAVRADLV